MTTLDELTAKLLANPAVKAAYDVQQDAIAKLRDPKWQRLIGRVICEGGNGIASQFLGDMHHWVEYGFADLSAAHPLFNVEWRTVPLYGRCPACDRRLRGIRNSRTTKSRRAMRRLIRRMRRHHPADLVAMLRRLEPEWAEFQTWWKAQKEAQ